MENELLENNNFIMYTTVYDGQVEIEVRAETEIAKNYLSKEKNV